MSTWGLVTILSNLRAICSNDRPSAHLLTQSPLYVSVPLLTPRHYARGLEEGNPFLPSGAFLGKTDTKQIIVK